MQKVYYGLKKPEPQKPNRMTLEEKLEMAQHSSLCYATAAACWPEELETYAILAERVGPDQALQTVAFLQDLYRRGGVC